MTEPKEQAVPVAGVEEAVERLTTDLEGCPAGDDVVCAVLVWAHDLRTILQSLQGSSLRDPHRATEQPVVGARNLISRDYSEELCERLRGIGERITGNTHLSGEIVSFGSVVERAARQIERFTAAGEAVNGEADLGGEETEGAWIEHEGGHNPVPGQKVDLCLRSGDEFTDEASGRWAWSHQNPAVDDDDQIVAYRLRQNKRRKLGGDEAEGGVHPNALSEDDRDALISKLAHEAADREAQLKAAYEALEEIANGNRAASAGYVIDLACQALARRGEGDG